MNTAVWPKTKKVAPPDHMKGWESVTLVDYKHVKCKDLINP